MKIAFAGGAMEVGGSCVCLRTHTGGILLDCGIRQGGSEDPIPDFRLIQVMGGVDAILISHAHMDHIGTLPILSRAYPAARIYMTPMTMELTRVLLLDSLKIMAQREEEIPHYQEADVSAMMDRITPLHEQAEMEVLPEHWAAFYPAGHIAGAACISLKTPEGTILYTGDYSCFAQQTIDGLRIPRLRPDVVITEATYGDKLHSNRQAEEQRLIRLVGDAVRRGVKILIPCFALGRAQEVILLLKEGMKKGEIPRVPVYVDGMVRDINRVYKLHPDCLRGKLARSILKGNDPFYSDEIRAVGPMEDRAELVEKSGPAVFVSSSGMLSGGPSVFYAEKIAPREDGMILITGYQDEEAPGRKLMQIAEKTGEPALGSADGAEGETPMLQLGGHAVPVRAQVERVGLSAHGDQGEILALLGKLSPRDIVLVHGDPEVIRGLTPHITGEYLRQVHTPAVGEVLEMQYRSLRRQVERNMPHRMTEAGMPDAEGMERLRQFVRVHYGDRELTALQIGEIWSGRAMMEAGEISAWQDLLYASPDFQSNPFRLFQFRALTEEEAAEARRPKGLTQQDISDLLRAEFASFPFRKISLYPEREEAFLIFSFPDAVDRDAFETAAKAFHDRTGWRTAIHPAVNHADCRALLNRLFGDRLLRVSVFEAERNYQIMLSGREAEDEEKGRTFERTTGWRLKIGTAAATAKAAPNGGVPSVDGRMEQNAAMAWIRSAAAEWPDSLQKISLRNDGEGKYLELTFVTPQVAGRYEEQIAALSQDTGWPLKAAKAVLQNIVIAEAIALCEREGVRLLKNPSWQPAQQLVLLRTDILPEKEVSDRIADDLMLKTGLPCIFRAESTS